MSWELLVVLALTLGAIVLFVTEALRVDVVALLVMAVLLATGILTPEQGLQGFSNVATVTIAAMFVLSEGLRQTGLVKATGVRLSALFKRNFLIALIAMMVGVGLLSAFINNTGVVAIFLPIVLGATRDSDIPPTRVLMAMSFAAMFGGVCTLLGTSTNILVSSLMADYGMAAMGMFEMAPLGLVFFAVGVAYMVTVGEWLTPDRGAKEELIESFEVGQYLTEIEIGQRCADVACTLANASFCQRDDATVLDVVRDGKRIEDIGDDTTLAPGDVVRLRCSAQTIAELEDRSDLFLRPDVRLSQSAGDLELFEAVIAPNSVLDGSTLEDIDFEELFDAHALAIRRSGEVLHHELTRERLRAGDVLLLEAPRDRIAYIQDNPAFVVVSEVGIPSFKEHMIAPVLLIIAAVVAVAAIDLLPIVTSAVLGALAMIGLRVVSAEQAYEAIDWQVIFLLGGILSLGIALEETGGIAIVADFITDGIGGYGPVAMLAGFYFFTAFLTGVMSNQATAVLLTPVAIQAAVDAGLDPRPFVLAIAFAASASFMTPVGYQTNTLVYSAGQYRFADFLKVGTPLTILFGIIAVILIPTIWPL